jgi:endonuclease VIII
VPEGDVVLRTSRRLHAALAGQVLRRCDLRWPNLATADLTGRTVLEVVSAGKHLLLRVDGDPALTLHSHLRMEGSWRVQPADRPVPSNPGVRAVLGTDRWTAVGLRLGVLELLRTSAEHTVVGHLGPDLLDPDLDHDEAAARLAADPERAIGEALLDQRVVAGVGNIYAAEALWHARISPRAPAASLGPVRVERLLEGIRSALADGARAATRYTEGPAEASLEVYGREGAPCRRCGGAIRRIVQAGRSTYYCPRCQAR